MGIVSTTGGNIYIVPLSSIHDRVDIQYVPAEVSISRRPKIGDIDIVGRNIPEAHYVGGTRLLKFTVDFYSVEANREDVIEKVRRIESWTYNEGQQGDAEHLKIVFGQMFKGVETWILRDVNVVYDHFEKVTFFPITAKVDLVFSMDTVRNPKRSEITL